MKQTILEGKIESISRVTFFLGFVLGDYVERYFLISTAVLGRNFLFSFAHRHCFILHHDSWVGLGRNEEVIRKILGQV